MKAKKQQGKRRPRRSVPTFLVVAFLATLCTSADRADHEAPKKAIPGYLVGALAFNGSPYNGVPYSEKRRKFFELLDAHPDRELGARLKGYFEQRRAEVDFESENYYRMVSGVGGYYEGHMDMGIIPPVPILTLDSLIFDRNYTTLEDALKTVTHEGYHLERIVNGDVPERLIGENADDPYTQADIKLLFEDEVEAARRGCELFRKKFTHSADEDLCREFYRHGIQALRIKLAKMYTEQVPSYRKHRDYVLGLAAQPDAQ